MKKIISSSTRAIFIIAILISGNLYSQTPANFWFFGWGGGANPMGIDFTNGGADPTGNSPVQYNGVASGGLYESITIQTDATKVLWYSNTHWVRDENHGIMPGVAGRAGGKMTGAQGSADGSATQGAVSFPFPGSTTDFVLIAAAAIDGGAHGLLYTDIDMALPGNGTALAPLGDLGTNLEVNITPGVNTNEMVGVFAPDCDNIWVVSHEHGTNQFVAVLFTAGGYGAAVPSFVGAAMTGNGGRGTLRISPDGTKIITVGGFSGGIQIFDFNATTGAVTVPAAGPNAGSTALGAVAGLSFGYGLEWSPNSRYAFIGGYPGFGGVRVYDATTGVGSTMAAAGSYGDLQIGPNGVIYIGSQGLGAPNLATITNPDSGPGATFNAAGWPIGGSGGWFGLPNTFSCPTPSICADTSLAAGPIPSMCTGTGSVDLSAFNGTSAAGTWTISASPGGVGDLATIVGTTFNVNSTVAGTYTVRHSLTTPGAVPCGQFADRTIVIDPLPVVTVNSASICVGDPAVTFTATSATATGWTWSGNGTGTAQTTSGTTAGNYTVLATDGTCSASATGVLTVNTPPTVTVNDASICAGDPAATFTATSATATAWVWSVNGTGTAQTTTGTTAGAYTVVASDGTCSATATGTLTVNAQPSVTVNDAAICAGDQAATFTATSATATGWTWSVNGTGTAQTTTGTTAGAYTVVVTDGNCTNTATGTLTVNALPSVTVNDASICEFDPAATFTATSATATGWTWSANGTGTAQTTTGIIAGAYTVVVTDGTCTNTATGTLTVDVLPAVSVNSESICVGDPAATFTATSATAAGYVWSVNGTGTAQTTTGTVAGDYTVVVTDGTCSNTATGILTINTIPAVSVNSETICAGDPAATFTATSTTASGWTWSANGTGTSPTTSGTLAGNYTVVVTDGNCTNTATGILTVNSVPLVSVNSESICVGDAAATFTATSATATGWTWSVNGMGTAQTTTGTTAGDYTVQVTDGTCVNSATGTLTVNALPSVTVGDESMCVGDPDATFTAVSATAAGWVWSVNGIGTAQTTTGSVAGNYTVVVTDGNCSNTATGTLTINSLPVVTVNSETICDGDAASIFTATSATATGWTWSVNGTGTAQTTSGNTAGNYTVIVTDGTCSASATGVLSVITAPSVSVNNESICVGDPAVIFTATSATASGWIWSVNGTGTAQTTTGSVAGDYTVVVTDGTCSGTATGSLTINTLPTVDLGVDFNICDGESKTVSIGNYATILWSDGSAGTSYSASITEKIDVLVTDGNGCQNVDSVNATLVAGATAFTLREDTTICEKANDEVLITVDDQGRSALWQDGSTSVNYVATVAGEYEVVLTDSNGCSVSDKVVLTGFCTEITLTMPNIFTPNGSGINDYMIPIEMEWADKDFMMANVQYIRFYVFNRWGVMVHATEGVLPRWDGNAPNGNACVDGTYYWTLQYRDAADNEHDLNGFVKLLQSY